MRDETTCPRIDALAGLVRRRKLQLSARARTGKRHATANQIIKRRGVKRGALALSHDGSVPLEAVRLECGENGIACARTAARLVDILDAQQPVALGRAGVAPARYRGNQRTEMQRAAWRGGKPAAVAQLDAQFRVLMPSWPGSAWPLTARAAVQLQ